MCFTGCTRPGLLAHLYILILHQGPNHSHPMLVLVLGPALNLKRSNQPVPESGRQPQLPNAGADADPVLNLKGSNKAMPGCCSRFAALLYTCTLGEAEGTTSPGIIMMERGATSTNTPLHSTAHAIGTQHGNHQCCLLSCMRHHLHAALIALA